MIAVCLEGRLGNQLFQYAFIWATARKLNTSFYIDSGIEPFLLPKYFNIPAGPFRIPDERIFAIPGYKNLFSFHLRRGFYGALKWLLTAKNGGYYKGYFQSETYFSPYQENIKKLFSIRNEYQQAYQEIAASLAEGKKMVVIHVRRGDYENTGLQLSEQYYQNALSRIFDPGNFYVIISDDPDAAEKQFNSLENKYISRNALIIDFQFLMNADLCIIANSSFSWWGAYLNKKKATVLAPRFWNYPESDYNNTLNIIPPNWIQINTQN